MRFPLYRAPRRLSLFDLTHPRLPRPSRLTFALRDFSSHFHFANSFLSNQGSPGANLSSRYFAIALSPISSLGKRDFRKRRNHGSARSRRASPVINLTPRSKSKYPLASARKSAGGTPFVFQELNDSLPRSSQTAVSRARIAIFSHSASE
jgi:hypothetical protein